MAQLLALFSPSREARPAQGVRQEGKRWGGREAVLQEDIHRVEGQEEAGGDQQGQETDEGGGRQEDEHSGEDSGRKTPPLRTKV